jgi:hypothetical protein
MDIDEETKRILTFIGLLVLVMQTTETMVDLVLTFVFQGREKLTLEVLERLEREKRARTLGRLVRQMRDRVDIHPALEGLLESFVEHRNQLTHRLGDVPGWDLETPEGRDVACKFLSNLQDENQKIMEIFLGFLIAWQSQHKLGILPRFPEEGKELLLNAGVYALVAEDLVFAKPEASAKEKPVVRDTKEREQP